MFREAWLVIRECPRHLIRSARNSAALLRSRSDTRPPSVFARNCFLWGSSDRSYLALAAVVQAAPGDDVVLGPPSVPRALVPLYGALVLQLPDGIVVARTARIYADALRRRWQGQEGSWRDRMRRMAFGVEPTRGLQQRPRVFGEAIHRVGLVHRKPPAPSGCGAVT